MAVLAILAANRDLTSLMRNHREMRYLVTPGNFIYGSRQNPRVMFVMLTSPAQRWAPTPASFTWRWRTQIRAFSCWSWVKLRAQPILVVGLGRETTPELAKLGRGVTRCQFVRNLYRSVGAMHVSPMVEPTTRKPHPQFGRLLDVLARAGYAVNWIDNQSGCKGVCQGSGIEYRKWMPRQGRIWEGGVPGWGSGE